MDFTTSYSDRIIFNLTFSYLIHVYFAYMANLFEIKNPIFRRIFFVGAASFIQEITFIYLFLWGFLLWFDIG